MFRGILVSIAVVLVVAVVLVLAAYLRDINRLMNGFAGRSRSYLQPMATSNTLKVGPGPMSW
jgi:hypothetical protein